MKNLFAELKTSLLLTLAFVVLLCGVYPLAVWAGAQLLFPAKANGSLLAGTDGAVRGSALLAQNFSSDKYFQPRPSAAGTGFDATSSGGTNLGPTSAKLANGSHAKDANGKDVNDPGNFDGIKDLATAYRAANGLKEDVPVPADAVTRSGSGLDPQISVANAELQAPRVARARGLSLAQVRALIDQNTADRDLGFLGEPGVNVLLLNVALDRLPAAAR
jgi:potassium-transporting ATPase KdpC subunit